jgi:hypothetical protein
MEELIDELNGANDPDERMEICDNILQLLEDNDIDTSDKEDDIKDLAFE